MQGFLVAPGNGPLTDDDLLSKGDHSFGTRSPAGHGTLLWSRMDAASLAWSQQTNIRTGVLGSDCGRTMSAARTAPESRVFPLGIPLDPSRFDRSLPVVEYTKMWVKS